MWSMSDFRHLPTPDEISRYDERWISDIMLLSQIRSHQNNNNTYQQIADKANAINKAMGRGNMVAKKTGG
jgi:predicted class III extradiol MEMO1 family dioxygenase